MYRVTAIVLDQEVEIDVEASSLSEAVNKVLSDSIKVKKIHQVSSSETGRLFEIIIEVNGMQITGTAESADIFSPLYQSASGHVVVTGVEDLAEDAA